MKVKKALALLLALVLTVGLLPGRALAADDDEFTVVNSEQELTDALNEGAEKIKLGKDISSKKELVLKQDIVFDLDGHTWSGTEFRVGKRGDITVQNGTVSFMVVVDGGKLTLTKLKLEGDIYCEDGKLVSMEDCTSTGGNGDDWPVGIIVREDGEVGTIKNCTINLAGNMSPSPLLVEGSIDSIEGCTFTALNKGDERFFNVVEIYDGGSIGTIKDCTITANGKNYCAGIKIWDGASVKSIEGCTITVKNTTTDEEKDFDDGVRVDGELGAVKECKITANCAVNCYGRIDEISGCTLNGEWDCVVAGQKSTIGSILSNTMTVTAAYARGIQVAGSVGTVAYNNMVQGVDTFLLVHENGNVDTFTNNVGDYNVWLNKGGEVGTISGNIICGIGNDGGTIALLGKNELSGGENGFYNEGTIKKTDDSSPVDSLDKSKWYYDAMAYAYDENLTFGIPDNQFKPDDKLTRSMLTQMLWSLEEWPASKIGTFTDVESGAWYRNSVSWAADKKIVEGYTDGSFKPDNNITREQVATILYRYVKNSGGDVSQRADLSRYSDASQISSYALEAMQWANAEGLINGTTGTTLSPKGNTTCAQMATILMNFMEE